MDSNKILADFQFRYNKVREFSIDIKSLDMKDNTAVVNCDVDYNIIKTGEDDANNFIGSVEFIIKVKAKAKNSTLFRLNLVMEGLFVGNSQRISEDQFESMLEVNGVATLSQLSRSYIMSITALSGVSPPLNLPMINIHALREWKHKSNEENK